MEISVGQHTARFRGRADGTFLTGDVVPDPKSEPRHESVLYTDRTGSRTEAQSTTAARMPSTKSSLGFEPPGLCVNTIPMSSSSGSTQA